MVRKMLKIEKESDGHTMSLRLSGRIQSADIVNITAQMGDDSVRILLDLSEVTLVDVEAVRFLFSASGPKGHRRILTNSNARPRGSGGMWCADGRRVIVGGRCNQVCAEVACSKSLARRNDFECE
jgi:hypothetical protein